MAQVPLPGHGTRQVTRRRGQGEGTIRHRADGRWEGRIDQGWEGGKHRARSVYARTRQEVVLKVRQLQQQFDAGQPSFDQRTTVGHLLETWLEAAADRLRHSTLVRYRNLVRHQLVPALGPVRLVQLQPANIAAAMSGWQAGGLSPRSTAQARAVLRAALADAVEWGMVSRNAAEYAKPPRIPRPQARLIPPEDVERIVAATADHPQLHRLVLLLLHTGLRRGEMLGLTWSNVNLDHRELHVTSELERANGAYRLEGVKSAASRRTLPLTPAAVSALEEERRTQGEARASAGPTWREPLHGLCFTTGTGAPRNGDSVTHQFQASLIRAGLPSMPLHHLRKGFGGLMLASGVDLATVSALLGHSSVSLTASTYAGVMPSLKREAADRLGRLLEPDLPGGA
jgi:integrase